MKLQYFFTNKVSFEIPQGFCSQGIHGGDLVIGIQPDYPGVELLQFMLYRFQMDRRKSVNFLSLNNWQIIGEVINEEIDNTNTFSIVTNN